MPDPYMGQVEMFAGNFAPRGWALCDGQLLSISQYQALFSILGTIYGGDGRTTFGLPDLRGRVPVHPGAGPGLSPRTPGQKGGEERVTLTKDQMPAHNHLMYVNNAVGNAGLPANKVLATEAKTDKDYGDLPAPPSYTLDTNCISNAGSGQSHDNMQPFLCINFIIALEGVYPPRN